MKEASDMRNFFLVILMIAPMLLAFDRGALYAWYDENLKIERSRDRPLTDEIPGPERHVGTEPEQHVSRPQDRSTLRAEYRHRIGNQFFGLSKQIEELEEMAKAVERKLPPEVRAKIASLKVRETIVKQKLMELGTSIPRDWHQVKSELERSLEDLKGALDSARYQVMMLRK